MEAVPASNKDLAKLHEVIRMKILKICEQLEMKLHRPISRVPQLSEHLTKACMRAHEWGLHITAWFPHLCMG